MTGSFFASTEQTSKHTKLRLEQKNSKIAEESEDHALGRSRGGFSTKINLVVDGKGLPLAFVLAPGQSHELIFAEEALNKVCVHTRKPGPPLRRPYALAGDKGYSAGWLREWMKAKNIEDVVPTKSNEKRNERFDKEKYKRRNVVERSIGWLAG